MLLITGATGFVGGHLAEAAVASGRSVRLFVRDTARLPDALKDKTMEVVTGDLRDQGACQEASDGVSQVVHAAAMVDEWGSPATYKAINIQGSTNLIEAFKRFGCKKTSRRFVHVSSLGVYEPRDHFGTCEQTPLGERWLDDYTVTKRTSEQVIIESCKQARDQVSYVVLRPGFIYGPRDQIVVPRLLKALDSGKFSYLGDGTKRMNNTFVGHLVSAILTALDSDQAHNEIFNVTDDRLVSKREFVETICWAAKRRLPKPSRRLPLGLAALIAHRSDQLYRLLRCESPPTLSKARYKFMGLSLDFSNEKLRRQLGVQSRYSFTEAVALTFATESLVDMQHLQGPSHVAQVNTSQGVL